MSIYEEDALTVRHPYPRYYEPMDFGATKPGITSFAGAGVTPEAMERMKVLPNKYESKDVIVPNKEMVIWRDSSTPFGKKTYQEILRDAQTNETQTTVKKSINESGLFHKVNWWLVLLLIAGIIAMKKGAT